MRRSAAHEACVHGCMPEPQGARSTALIHALHCRAACTQAPPQTVHHTWCLIAAHAPARWGMHACMHARLRLLSGRIPAARVPCSHAHMWRVCVCGCAFSDKTLDRDFFMSSEEAQAFGLLDHIVTQREDSELA